LQVEGALETGDLVLADDHSLYDEYSFAGRSGQTFVMTLESAEFDTYLHLLSPAGETIAQNDDDGSGSTHSRLAVTLTADGVFRVWANAYDEQGRGRYRLTVREIAADSPEFLSVQADQVLQQGREQLDRRQFPQALALLNQALAIYRQVGNRSGEGNALYSIGDGYYYQFQFPQAIEFYQQSLVIRQDLGDRRNAAVTLNDLGISHDHLGQYRQALEYHQQSLAIRQEIGDRSGEGVTRNNIGLTYDNLGQYPQALEYFQQSLAIRQEIGDRRGEGATLNNIGGIYNSLGQYPQALESFQQSLTIRQEIGDRAGEGQSLNNIGSIYDNLGQYPQALEYYQQSLAIRQEIGDRRGEGATFNNIGGIYDNLGQYPQALEYYQQSLAITQEIGDREGEALTLGNIGAVFKAQAQPELAIVFYKEAINTYEQIRQTNQALEQSLQDSYTATIEDTYRHLADLLLQQDRILEAQRVIDLLKLQELDNYLRGIRRDGELDTGLGLREAEAAILRLYEAKQNELIALGQELADLAAIPVAERTDEQVARITELRRLEGFALETFKTFLQSDAIEEQVARLRRTTGAANLEINDLNALRDNLKQLDQNAVVLYPLVLPDRLELVLVSANAAPVRRTTIVDHTELNRVIGNLRYALEAPDRDAETPAQQLYDWLIRPIEADLTQSEAETIIYAPDEQLRYIPLATLYDGNQWLVQRYRVQNITAANLADLNTTPSRGDIRVLAAAFTEGSYEVVVGGSSVPFSGLAHAGLEIKNLVHLIPQTVQRLNQDFHPDIIYEMDDYQIVHLATHATFNPGPPENSFIMFGNGDHANLIDIERWSFPNVELIVLSACETAVGDVPLGDGKEILGFGYLMQEAGADAAIASLWSVDDGGTQLLMDEFYNALSRGGLAKAEALRQAQLSFINAAERRGGFVLADGTAIDPNDLSHPHYWAPFILIGNGL
jgi:CHAT domain-containing protein